MRVMMGKKIGAEVTTANSAMEAKAMKNAKPW